MKEVSCRVFDIFFRELKKSKISPEFMVQGTRYSVAHLRNKHERIEWSQFARVMSNLEQIWSSEDLVRIGESFAMNPLIRPFFLAGRILFSAEDFYVWLSTQKTGPGNQLFTCIEASGRKVATGLVEMTLTLPEKYERANAFFLVTQGCLLAFPRQLGLGVSQVEMLPTTRGALYKIQVPIDGGVWASFRKMLRAPFVAQQIARELKETNENLAQRLEQLVEAQRLLDRQATQLRTAHSISGVIHAGLDVEKTLESVALALTDVGNFAAVEINLFSDLQGRPMERIARGGVVPELGEAIRVSLQSRGLEFGAVVLWPHRAAVIAERRELLEYVVPTIAMALDEALTFSEVVDYRKNLELKVAERTGELSEARDRLAETVANLQQAQSARDRIFANINHEIRTPLSLITLSLTGLRKIQGKLVDEESKNYFDSIESNVRRLLDLVDGLLLLAAGQEGKLKIRPQAIDLSQLCAHLVAAWRPPTEAAGLKLTLEIQARVTISADPAGLERVLSNLISNAVKFTPMGGTIALEIDRLDDRVQIQVRDTGIGLDDEFKKRIFGRFEQGRAPIRAGAHGSGIGLAIVKELIEAHGGDIIAESNRGPGTTFRIILPYRGMEGAAPFTPMERSLPRLDYGQASSVAGPSQAPVACAQGTAEATILVAEDDPELRLALTRILSPRYRVIEAHDGLSALAAARDYYPDLLLTDLGMPGMDGLELSRRFRELPGNRLAPVVLLTAYGALSDRLRAFESGALDYVLKPFQPDELLARIRSQLAMRTLALRLHDTEKLAALGMLSAGLAHELRNPANVVVNAIEPLKALLPPELLLAGTPTSELLSVLADCALNIGNLSRQLLGCANNRELTVIEARFEDVLGRAATMVAPALKLVTLRKLLSYNGSFVCAPPFLIQAFSNLLENAAHAAGQGGWVEVVNRVEGDRLVIEVGDSGGGVPMDIRERIFEPFFTTKPPGQGTGLGLTTTRQIIEQHKGSIRVVDGPGGSRFQVSLPIGMPQNEPRSLSN